MNSKYESRITGQVRFRSLKRLFKPNLVILQVEECHPDGQADWRGMPSSLACTSWRDAEPCDLQYLTLTGEPK